VGLLLGSKKLGGKSGNQYDCGRHHHDSCRILFTEATLKPWKGYLLWWGDTDTSLPLYLAHEMDVSVVGVIPTAYGFWIINFIKEIASKVQGKASGPEFWQALKQPKIPLYHLSLELMDFVKLRE
jgi:hypothetical protein